MDLREQVRAWLIDERVGLIDRAELVARADRAIGELDIPPDYLIAVSLGKPLTHVPRLDLLKYRPTKEDLGGLALRLLARLESGRITLEKVAVVASRVAFPKDDALIDVWLEFNWITDELHLIEQGVKDRSNFRDGVIAALRKAAESAAK